MTRNSVVVNEPVTHYLIDRAHKMSAHVLVHASGTCNEKPFETLLYIEEGLDSKAFLFCSFAQEPFTTAEYHSIRRKLKNSAPNKVVDKQTNEHRGSWPFEERLHEQLTEKHHGKLVLLEVPFDEKEDAKKLGAGWDPIKKKWGIRALHPNHGEVVKRWKTT